MGGLPARAGKSCPDAKSDDYDTRYERMRSHRFGHAGTVLFGVAIEIPLHDPLNSNEDQEDTEEGQSFVPN